MAEPKKTRALLDAGQAVTLVGLLAAMVLAVVANVVVARHYKRWDWTKARRSTTCASRWTSGSSWATPTRWGRA